MKASKQQAKSPTAPAIERSAPKGPESDNSKVVAISSSFRQSDRDELSAIAANGSTDHACALAKRRDLDEKVIILLAHRPEREVLCALANNGRAMLGRKALRPLMERGRQDSNLARALLRRESLHLCHFRLFLQADSEERGHLIAVARHSRLDVVHGLYGIAEPDPAKLARLEHSALTGNRAAFDLALARALACDLSTANQVAADKGGEALALAFAALGLSNETAARIFLAGFPEICDTSRKFRTLMHIVESVPRRAASRLIHIIVATPATLAAA
jgi:uncharacterized protein (DUF2336 family)